MKKFEGLLFCTDLDGTLYSDDKTVSKENLNAIEYFKSEGGLFTFITGRAPITAVDVYNTVKPNAPYGCMNGAGVYDPIEGKYLWTMPLSDDVFELIVHVEEHLPAIGTQINTENGIYFYKDNVAQEWFRRITGVPYIPCKLEGFSESLIKIVFAHHEEEMITELANLLDKHPRSTSYDFIRSEKRLYEILPKGVNKGLALKKLAELLNVDMRKTIAVGDYNNDVSMLKEAGLSFAVSNAVDEAKAAADLITANNNEHAIAAIIDGLDRGTFSI